MFFGKQNENIFTMTFSIGQLNFTNKHMIFTLTWNIRTHNITNNHTNVCLNDRECLYFVINSTFRRFSPIAIDGHLFKKS